MHEWGRYWNKKQKILETIITIMLKLKKVKQCFEIGENRFPYVRYIRPLLYLSSVVDSIVNNFSSFK